MSRIQVQTPSTALRPKSISPKFDDSPSRQLMLDLERALSQTQIHEAELHKVYNYQQRLFQENLDKLDRKRAQEDIAAIDAATSRHETVRKEAEAELHRYYKEVERQERLKREDEDRRLREQQAQAKAEAERKAKEEAERIARIEREQAAARKAAEDKVKAEQVERQKREEALAQEKAEEERKQKAEQEKARLIQQAVDKKAADEKAAEAEAAAQAAAKDKQIVRSQGQPATVSTSGNEAQHQRYLQIHQNLKRFRKEFWAQCKKDANLKSKVGDMRRAIKTSVGQLTDTKGANRQPTERIKSTLKDALTIPSPSVDIRDYFAVPPPELNTPEQSQCPSLLVYAMNIFSKAIISQFGGESGISISAAEPAGVLVAQIFASPEYQIQGHSLIDILLAKLHLSCPVLWGVYGDERTAEGRMRLGWRREDGAFVSESRHHERVSGLGAGFASIALRNFSKSRLRNPFPPTNFWECLSNMLNVPPNDVQPTHLFVLKAMLENSAERFIQCYGTAAVAALRLALVDFPTTLPPKVQDTAGSKSITLLADYLAREKNLRLD